MEEITSGAIPAKAMGYSLSIGVACSLGLAMVRVLTGVSILWFLIPGLCHCAGASLLYCRKFLPPLPLTPAEYVGTDDGDLPASPLRWGACEAVGGNIVNDAFGVVAMVAMTPLITIQVLGLIYKLRSRTGAGIRADAGWRRRKTGPSLNCEEDG